jgi:FkbM family methyltransferase
MKNILKKFLFIVIYVQNSFSISFTNTDDMLSFAKSILPESPVLFEAGGHYGEDTYRMKDVWPNSKIYVSEPCPNSFERLIRSTKNLKDVICYPYAFTNYSGKVNFYVDLQNSGASSIDYPVWWMQHGFDKKPIEVLCSTIDAWAESNKISNIDFMWLDMEGHELCALQYAVKILKTVKAIYTEINYVPIRLNSCLYKDLRDFLELQGFCEIYKSKNESGIQGDAFFVNKNLLK